MDPLGPPRAADGAPWWERTAPLWLPMLLFGLLQPETFGVVPNNLDPFFYTGLGINLGDAIASGGSHYYFVSRWSAYYPLYLTDAVAGPVVGRLLLRLLVAALVLRGLWRLRPDWSVGTRLAIGALVVSMPMFLRAIFTDYVESAVVAYVFGLVLLALGERRTTAGAVLVGLLTGLLVVANPVAILAAVGPLVCYTLLVPVPRREQLRASLIVIATAVVVVLVGLAWFRLVHGIDDIYRPTLEFVSSDPGPDPLKSPRLDWLGHFTWIWMAPLLLGVAGALAVMRTVRFDRRDVAAFALCGVQFALQCADQFLRDGNGLEISYYWSMSYPSFAVALAFLVARLAPRLGLRSAAAAVALGCVALVVGIPDALRLPSGAGGALVVVVAGAALVVVVAARLPAIAAAMVAGLVVWSQIGAPIYDPSAYHPYDTSPRYDRLFWSDGDPAETWFAEARWFADQMDTVDDDDDSFFVATAPFASSIFGLYQAHVTGRIVALDESLTPTAAGAAALALGDPALLTFLGDPDTTAAAIDRIGQVVDLGSPVLDRTHDGALGYRLVVFRVPGKGEYPKVIEADSMLRLTGRAEATDVVVEAGEPAGIVSYGPYVQLGAGTYDVVLHYRSPEAEAADVGAFEVFAPTLDQVAVVGLIGTAGLDASVTLTFEVTSSIDQWEFRTTSAGAELTIDRVELTRRSE